MQTEDPHEWWAKRAAEISVLMKNTGVGELIIRRKPDGKYTFEITPEWCQCEKPGPHFHPGSRGKFCAVCGKDILHNAELSGGRK